MRKMWSSGNTACKRLVQLDRRREVAPERLLDDDPAASVQTDRRQLLATIGNIDGGIAM